MFEEPYLFVQEFKISSTLIRYVIIASLFGLFLCPFNFAVPVILLVLLISFIVKYKV